MDLYDMQKSNIKRTWILMATFFALVVFIGWILANAYQNAYIFYAIAGFAMIFEIISFWFSDKIALKMSGAQQADPVKYKNVYSILENLSITAGIKMPKLYIIHDDAPNAFATGRDIEHSAVAVTDGLLAILNKSELEGVLAHELSHIQNKDTLVMTVASVLVGFLAMLADLFFRMALWGVDKRDSVHPLVFVFAFVAVLLAPVVGNLMSLAISRKREYLADASGALLTRYPEGLASALEKISAYAKPMKKANHATAHLFISNPFGNLDKQGILSKIEEYFSTHPPITKRIKALRGMKID